MALNAVVWITFTTRYREGGARFAQVAQTLAAEKRRAGQRVVCEAVESKAEFLQAVQRLEEQGHTLSELHFIGHSGMYGIMFGTRQWPEQFSPHEWESLRLPFAPGASATFHACRTARWFAPFFADTFQVPTYGYFWYTALSGQAQRFSYVPQSYPSTLPLYAFGCPGMKSHGLAGSVKKYLNLSEPEALKRFEPQTQRGQRSYDPVADLYNATFQDIRVRRDEWAWLQSRLTSLCFQPKVLDWGCGNGALLQAVAGQISYGVGVDTASAMVKHAQHNCASLPNLNFQTISGPSLPFADRSFDVVLSLLSFRYLDWDPTWAEVQRVLKPGGRLWVIDMVAKAPQVLELPRICLDKGRQLWRRYREPRFEQALQRMVNDPRWHTLLTYNPMRSDHEFRWYLQSRCPNGQFRLLNRGVRSQVLAFDSGPLY